MLLIPIMKLSEYGKSSQNSGIVHSRTKIVHVSTVESRHFFNKAVLQPSMVFRSRGSCNGIQTITLVYMGTSTYIVPSLWKLLLHGTIVRPNIAIPHPDFHVWYTLQGCLSDSVLAPEIYLPLWLLECHHLVWPTADQDLQLCYHIHQVLRVISYNFETPMTSK